MASAIVPGVVSTAEAMERVRASLGPAVQVRSGRSGGFVVVANAFVGAGVRVAATDAGTEVAAHGLIPSMGARLAVFAPAIVLLVLSFVAWEDATTRQAWARILGGVVLMLGAGLMFANGMRIGKRVVDVFRGAESSTEP